MMRTLAQTGQGWMTFKDASNRTCNQTSDSGEVGAPMVHLSNLCTEIIEVSSDGETAVCNLGSVNVAAHLSADRTEVDWERLRETVRTAVPFLDRVIDVNFYPSPESAASNPAGARSASGSWACRTSSSPCGCRSTPPRPRSLSTRISEEIYLTALEVSCTLAEREGAHPAYDTTRASRGQAQPDLWDVTGTQSERWAALRERIAEHGLRNSLLIAIAPTATIASIAGCYECIEPQVSNLFKRETLSGEFMQVNNALVRELKSRDLWSPEVREQIKRAEGSVQGITALPEDVRHLFRTAWEAPQRALIEARRRTPAVHRPEPEPQPLPGLPDHRQGSGSMYLFAWKSGLKTTYYLRSRPATRIQQATTSITPSTPALTITDEAAVACSLENPETCEACE